MGKKGLKNYNGKSRLICDNFVTTDGKNFYLYKWSQNKWKRNGGRKSLRELHPLFEGIKYDFFVSEEVKGKLYEISMSKKFSLLVKKLSSVD